MNIIDAHVHVWTPDTAHYPLAAGYKADMPWLALKRRNEASGTSECWLRQRIPYTKPTTCGDNLVTQNHQSRVKTTD